MDRRQPVNKTMTIACAVGYKILAETILIGRGSQAPRPALLRDRPAITRRAMVSAIIDRGNQDIRVRYVLTKAI